ncbi:MAG: cupredoxin domain-containing protein [Actinomycetota bacterium]
MRKPLLILLALVALLGAACGGDGGTGGTTPTATADPTEAPCEDQTGDDVVSVTMTDNAFEPTCIVANQSQGLHLQNDGALLHSFTITPGDVDFDVQPGEPFNADGPIPLEPAEYPFTCKYHPEMSGTVTIEA